jgi:hypothetical protein
MEIRLVVDDRLVNALSRVRAFATRRRVGLLCGCFIAGSGLVAVAAPISKPHTLVAGQRASAAQVNANFDALYEAFNAGVIRESQTVVVPVASDCSGLTAAIEGLDEKRIASTAVVTIRLEPGSYECNTAIQAPHANGARLRIVGGGDDPSDVTLRFPKDVNGVTLELGAVLGGLENLTLAGPDSQSAGMGIFVSQGAAVRLAHVVVRDFGSGITAQSGASITGSDVTATSNFADGIRAMVGGVVALNDASSTANGQDGFRSDERGVMDLVNVTAHDNYRYGFLSTRGGAIRALDCVATSNPDAGFFAQEGGALIVQRGETSGNGWGFLVQAGGFLSLTQGPLNSDNSEGAQNLASNTPDSTGAVIVE